MGLALDKAALEIKKDIYGFPDIPLKSILVQTDLVISWLNDCLFGDEGNKARY